MIHMDMYVVCNMQHVFIVIFNYLKHEDDV